jgi:hypothetical protein
MSTSGLRERALILRGSDESTILYIMMVIEIMVITEYTTAFD